MPDNEIEAKKPPDEQRENQQPIGGGLVGLSGERKTATEIAGVNVDLVFLRSQESYSAAMGIGTWGATLAQSKFRSYLDADAAARMADWNAGRYAASGISTTTFKAASRDFGFTMGAQLVNYGLDKTVFADTHRTWRSLVVDIGSLALVALPKPRIETKAVLMVGAHIGGRIWDSTVPKEPPAPPKAKEEVIFDSDQYIKK